MYTLPPLRDGYFPPLPLCLAGVADWSTCCLSCCCVLVEFGLLPPWNLLFKEPATCGYLCWPRRNITGYLDFTSSDVQVVHIVGPPGFGKSTLAKQIGHILLRKGVKVYNADIRAVTDLDTVAEKIMLGIVDSTKHKVTFDHLKRWVHTAQSIF